ncbi:MAG TPA: CDP-alcohol phosphatidyltransferase family protein [Blastocatellia bacterium]|nr:CDP-alcohol phosphatidyltransferase family protein [Blastocatellia bacterium]
MPTPEHNLDDPLRVDSEKPVLTVATALTCLRIALTFPFLYLIGLGRFDIALIVFFFAGVTDFADGYIARRFNQQSRLGQLLDPLADKFLIASAFVVMALPHSGFPSIPIWLAVLVIGRDILILIGAGVVFLMTRFSEFRPTWFGKTNTLVELGVIGTFLLFHTTGLFIFMLPSFYAILVVCVLISGTEYVMQGIRVLRHQPQQRPPSSQNTPSLR